MPDSSFFVFVGFLKFNEGVTDQEKIEAVENGKYM